MADSEDDEPPPADSRKAALEMLFNRHKPKPVSPRTASPCTASPFRVLSGRLHLQVNVNSRPCCTPGPSLPLFMLLPSAYQQEQSSAEQVQELAGAQPLTSFSRQQLPAHAGCGAA